MEHRPWEIVETRILGRTMAQVSKRENRDPSRPPAYSIRVGTTQVMPDGTTRVSAHMSIYDTDDAETLLKTLSEKYREARAEPHKLGLGQSYRRTPSEG